MFFCSSESIAPFIGEHDIPWGQEKREQFYDFDSFYKKCHKSGQDHTIGFQRSLQNGRTHGISTIYDFFSTLFTIVYSNIMQVWRSDLDMTSHVALKCSQVKPIVWSLLSPPWTQKTCSKLFKNAFPFLAPSKKYTVIKAPT